MGTVKTARANTGRNRLSILLIPALRRQSPSQTQQNKRTHAGKSLLTLVSLLAMLSITCTFGGLLPGSFGSTEISGPIIAMVTAASLDEHGQIVDQRYSFAPTTPQMTVVVQIGGLTSSTPLNITWYLSSDAGEEKLFEHTIQVEAFDRAYSVGLNSGLLATGTYKAVATLGDQKQTITWVVVEEQSGPSAEISQGSNSAQTQQGKAPTSGSSGKVPASQKAAAQPTPIPGCEFDVVALPQPPEVTATGGVVNGDATSCASLGTGDIAVMASIGGNQPKQACHFSFTTSDLYCTSNGDPCDLPGGSDLPGTVVNLDLLQKNTGQVLRHDTATFSADSAAPEVQLVSDPLNGVKVKEGQKIKLTGNALENKVSGWQTGVAKIYIDVIKPSYEEMGPESYDTLKGKSCSEKSWKQKTKEFTYTVPKDVKGVVRICAFADDFAGNTGKDCAEFPTGDHWKGTIRSTSNAIYAGGAGTCVNEKWLFNLDIYVAADGTVAGKGTGQLTASPQCRLNGWNGVFEGQMHNTSFDVTGKLDGQNFQLFFADTYRDGKTYGLMDFALLYSGTSIAADMPPFIFSIQGQGSAAGDVTIAYTPANASGDQVQAEHIINMTCLDCK